MTPPIHIHVRNGLVERIEGIQPGMYVYVTDHDAAAVGGNSTTLQHSTHNDNGPTAMMDHHGGTTSALVYDGLLDDPLVHVRFQEDGTAKMIRVRPDAKDLVILGS